MNSQIINQTQILAVGTRVPADMYSSSFPWQILNILYTQILNIMYTQILNILYTQIINLFETQILF